jgi:putative tryptophan/tyrosine transport system permease protein
MNLLLGSLTIGLILSLLALGVYIAFRIFGMADITADGSITLGGAVTAVLLIQGVDPMIATLAGCLSGAAAGMLTGILHTRFGIHSLLSGILMMTALYSINLWIMGRSNVPLLSVSNLTDSGEKLAVLLFGPQKSVLLLGWDVSSRDMGILLGTFAWVCLTALLLFFFFKTELGTAMRATGDNPQMIRALGVNTGNMIVLGLGLANGLVALSGALLAQFQGFADVQMGIGMIVWGVASVIIGESLVRTRRLGLAITGAIMGAVLFRLLLAIALRFGLNPNNLKLITAIFVFFALVSPAMLDKLRKRRKGTEYA